MPTILITGAGRGLGLEFARQYAKDGWTVIATIRDTRQGAALAALGRTVEIHQLDVAELGAIDRLATELKGRAIDVLLSNAGIGAMRGVPATDEDYRAWQQVLLVNALAPHALARAFTEHVAASERRIIAMISSRMGSIAGASGGATIYRSSKAALNLVAKNLAAELAPRQIAVVAFHPGWVRTDMGGAGAPLPVDEAVGQLRQRLADVSLADSGTFLNYDGSTIPW